MCWISLKASQADDMPRWNESAENNMQEAYVKL